MYIFANKSEPIGFTAPHSGYVPPGAVVVGFGKSADGQFTWSGKQLWKACKTSEVGSWQIYWDGVKSGNGLKGKDCTAVGLKVGSATECRYPQA